jgi:hypothetical protein
MGLREPFVAALGGFQFVAPSNQIRFDGLCFLSITPLLFNP